MPMPAPSISSAFARHVVRLCFSGASITAIFDRDLRAAILFMGLLLLSLITAAEAHASPWEWRSSVIPNQVFETRDEAEAATRGLGGRYALIEVIEKVTLSDTAASYVYGASPKHPIVGEWGNYVVVGASGTFPTEAEAMASAAQNSGAAVCPPSWIEVASEWRTWSVWSNGMDYRQIRDYNLFMWRNINGTPQGCLYPLSPTLRNGWRERTIACPIHLQWSTSEFSCVLHNIVTITGKVLVCTAPTGNPCDAGTGDKSISEVDFTLPWIMFKRHYHSYSRAVNETLGVGWNHSLGASLAMNGSTPSGRLAVDGNQIPLRSITTGVYEETTGSNVRVVKVGAEWIAALGDGSREVYSSAGKLLRVQRADGLALTLAYDSDGLLSSVTHSTGRALAFRYDGVSKNLVGVDLDGVPLVEYEYGSGRLAKVIYPGGLFRTYLYEDLSFPNHITGIKDESTDRYATYGYDAMGRAVLTEHAGGADRNTLAFNTDGTTTVVEPSGREKVYAFSSDSYYRKLTGLQDQGYAQSWVRAPYASDFRRRVTSSQDARGFTTNFQYSDTGIIRTERRIEAAGTPEQRTIELDHDLTLGRLAAQRTTDRNIQFAYNPRGQQIAHCEHDPADAAAMAYTCSATTSPPPGARVRRTVSTYCEATDVTAGTCPLEGLLIAVNGPRSVADPGMGGLDDIITYTYRAADDPTCATNGACSYRKGDLWKVTNALGQVTETVSHDKAGRVTRTKDANGVLTDFAYHPRGWLVDRIVRASVSGTPSADDATTHIDYDAVGNVTRTTQADGNYLHYTYDAAHRLLKVEDALGNALDYCPGGVGSADCLDAAGNRRIEQVKDAGGTVKRSLRRTYNQLGQLTAVLNAQGQTTLSLPAATGYDANGNPTHALDGLGVETVSEYDPLNRLKKTIQDYLGPDLATRDTTTEYTYDARDNLRTVKDPDNLTTTYDYDGLNDLTGLHSPDTGTTAYTYDLAGNRISQTDARGVTSIHVYDALNRLTAIQYPTAALDVGFSYDQPNATTGCAKSFPLGRLTRITDASGSTTYCYDRRGNVTRKTQVTAGLSQAIATTWTKADRVETITYPSGGIATYTRNASGQVSAITWKASSLAPATAIVSSATWYPFGPLNGLTFGNGRTLTKTYDANYAIDSIASSDPNGLILDLTTDVMGNITEARDTLGAATPTRTYQYDRLYRLKNVIDGGSGPTLEGYGYTKTGDRTQKTLPGQSPQVYAYLGGTHRLGSIDGVTRAYDANGNTTGLPDVPYPLVYDEHNRLSQMQFLGAGSNTDFSYGYNGKGERVRKLKSAYNDTQTQTALYDEGGRLVREHASRTCTGGAETGRQAMTQATGVPCNGTRVVELIYLDDLPVAQVTDGAISYLETDHLSTPRVAANPATNAWQWKWSFFGSAFGEHLPTQPTTGGIEVSLRYPGQQYDAEAGLHYNYFRDYEPGTGRYIESDPIGLEGGVGTFGYAQQDPLRTTDPRGLFVDTNGTFLQTCVERSVSIGTRVLGGIGLLLTPNTTSRCQDYPPPPDAGCPDLCSPCDPPVGSIGYRIDTTHPHYSKKHGRYLQPHMHVMVRMQSPPSAGCKCFWSEVSVDPPPPDPTWHNLGGGL